MRFQVLVALFLLGLLAATTPAQAATCHTVVGGGYVEDVNKYPRQAEGLHRYAECELQRQYGVTVNTADLVWGPK